MQEFHHEQRAREQREPAKETKKSGWFWGGQGGKGPRRAKRKLSAKGKAEAAARTRSKARLAPAAKRTALWSSRASGAHVRTGARGGSGVSGGAKKRTTRSRISRMRLGKPAGGKGTGRHF